MNSKTDQIKNRELKTRFWAYIFWAFGGFFGAHHFYLGRDVHGLVYLFTLGGYCGIGWIRDLWWIRTYVDDANDDPNFLQWFKHQVRSHRKPPFSSARFLGEVVVSFLFGQLVSCAIPVDEIYGINFRPLIILIPFAVAFGVWLVGNIGRERGSIWGTLIVSYFCYPALYYIGDETNWIGLMVAVASLFFDTFSKQWKLAKEDKPSRKKRIAIILFSILLYAALWSSFFYFNATITDSEGEEIKLTDALKHFLTSPIWLDLKTSLEETWKQAKHQGFWGIWRQLIDLSDPRGELNAYKVLELSQTASQSEISAKWRALSKQHHPDKIKGTEEEKRKAKEKFMDIQNAYEILSKSKSRRKMKNRKASS